MDNGEIIEFLKIDNTISNEFLHRKLPEGVVNIRTVLQSRDDNDKRADNKRDIS